MATINGTSGSDNLVGGFAVEDKLYGLGGNDVLTPGGAVKVWDTVDGGTGWDTISYRDSLQSVNVDLGFEGNHDGWSPTHYDIIYSVEHVWGSDQDDVIRGNSGYNELYGFGGNDTFEGLGGNNVLDGGAGIDTAIYSANPNAVQADLAIGKATHGATGHYDMLVSIENLVGSAHGDTLYGDSKANRLEGGGGHDYLNGRAGNDVLKGDGGNDRLVGGIGADELWGGTGADIFHYNTVNESFYMNNPTLLLSMKFSDRIMDFNASEGDRIDLSNIDAKSGQSGKQSFQFIGSQAFSAEGQVRVQQASGGMWVEANTSGTGAAEMEIFMVGVQSMSASDFIL
jgi:serralysin